MFRDSAVRADSVTPTVSQPADIHQRAAGRCGAPRRPRVRRQKYQVHSTFHNPHLHRVHRQLYLKSRKQLINVAGVFGLNIHKLSELSNKGKESAAEECAALEQT